MPQYQNILVAIDFSEYGMEVALKAKQLAEQFNAPLNVLHVLDNIPIPDTPYGTVIPLDTVDLTNELLEIEKKKFKQICDQLNIDPDRRWLIWGEPQHEITQTASQEKIDLIIVGSHGHHGLAILVGSTAKGVLYHANCDVLAIHLRD
ncbi:MAG: universal stress protein [Nitrosomonas sp.]|nr:universal stress protein [Nitrosomonas sp.]